MILICNPSGGATLDSTSTRYSTPIRDTVTSWIKVAGEKILYHFQAGFEANNLPQSDRGSELWLWRNLTSSSRSAMGPLKTTPTIMVSDFMALMRQRHPLYRCVAGVEPNNLPQSDRGSEQWLWRNLSSSFGIARTPFSPVTSWIKIAEGWTLHH